MTETSSIRPATLKDALVPLISLFILLASSVILFSDDSSYGPNQIALILSAFIASLMALKNGFKWKDIEQAMIKGISLSMGAILILLAVGALIGTWIVSGTVPTLIYFGLSLLSPAFFYTAACIICAVVAISIGSSWTVAATIGVALMGVAQGLGMDQAITAGAVISGAYFGDKMSPFSDTTNLAPAVAGSELFSHIRYMAWTSIPSLVISLILFTVIGFFSEGGVEPEQIGQMKASLSASFNIGVAMLAPLGVLLFLAFKKMPAFPAVFLGALIGCVWAVIFQPQALSTLTGSDAALEQFKTLWAILFDGVVIETDSADLNDLLSGGGMSSMLNTVWLIISAMIFGAVMEKAGFLQVVIQAIVSRVKTIGGLVSSTVATCVGSNLVTADQYISIVMPGRMYKEEYEKQELDNLNLSRTLEDAGTLSSPLIPWNTCGAYMHSVLLVHPFEYLFFCFFNLLNPILAIIYAYVGFKILRIKPKNQAASA
ncbi:Na+/H+ antiporter NhaC [Catenovulum sp. SM1970]|uniref:Na+/H+ antiporter NhaC n=1 Tax=Marinifaba aquimaris TaxID=2741323 RepID=UPI0015735103|nr:Na+/H+ antiporter NhaC [Marinifaba aquimaris]NTS76069.1 Na+/H+ antiporter NhaC [Marinifaba aquimaris]